MAFPLYGPSLYHFMKKKNNFHFHFVDVWKIARQSLESLKCLFCFILFCFVLVVHFFSLISPFSYHSFSSLLQSFTKWS